MYTRQQRLLGGPDRDLHTHPVVRYRRELVMGTSARPNRNGGVSTPMEDQRPVFYGSRNSIGLTRRQLNYIATEMNDTELESIDIMDQAVSDEQAKQHYEAELTAMSYTALRKLKWGAAAWISAGYKNGVDNSDGFLWVRDEMKPFVGKHPHRMANSCRSMNQLVRYVGDESCWMTYRVLKTLTKVEREFRNIQLGYWTYNQANDIVALMRLIRESGAMKAALADSVQEEMSYGADLFCALARTIVEFLFVDEMHLRFNRVVQELTSFTWVYLTKFGPVDCMKVCRGSQITHGTVSNLWTMVNNACVDEIYTRRRDATLIRTAWNRLCTEYGEVDWKYAVIQFQGDTLENKEDLPGLTLFTLGSIFLDDCKETAVKLNLLPGGDWASVLIECWMPGHADVLFSRERIHRSTHLHPESEDDTYELDYQELGERYVYGGDMIVGVTGTPPFPTMRRIARVNGLALPEGTDEEMVAAINDARVQVRSPSPSAPGPSREGKEEKDA